MPVFDGQLSKIYNTDLDDIEIIWADCVTQFLKNKEKMEIYNISSVIVRWEGIFEKLDKTCNV